MNNQKSMYLYNQGIFQRSELEYPFSYYRVYWLNIHPPVNPHSSSAYGKEIDRLLDSYYTQLRE